ncbi:MAG: tetratricopeptide (TPR) repeat protein [Myxococcota bacterium]
MTYPRGHERTIAIIVLPLLIAALLAPTTTAFAEAKSELRFQQGVAAFGAREFGAAREAFENFLEENPEDLTALRYLGLISRYENNDREAIEFFNRALSITPTDVLTYVALAETLLKAEQNVPALETLTIALTLAPQHPRLHLYKGIVEYRLRNLQVAIEHFEDAVRLDPNMEREARYYTGLTQAILGNLYASAEAFTEVADGSPAHPLGRSARDLRKAMEPATPDQRWTASATTGVEFDTNPTAATDLLKPSSDIAGNFGARGLYDVYRGDGLTIRAGYDGFLLKHVDEERVDEQTHVARAVALYDNRDVRLSLRYDGSITLLDFTEKFRALNQIEPAVSIRTGQFGISQAFYRLEAYDYFIKTDVDALKLDGLRHTIGFTQSFIPPEPYTYLRIGFDWANRTTDGDEFDNMAFSMALSGGVLLPWNDIELSALYRFSHVRFKHGSVFPKKGFPEDGNAGSGKKRNENVHRISFNVNVPVWSRLSMDVAGAFTFRDSDVEIYRYDRQIIGTYLTWDFGGTPRPKRTAPEKEREDEGRFPGE